MSDDDCGMSLRHEEIDELVMILLKADRVQMPLEAMDLMEATIGHTWPLCHRIEEIPTEGLRGILYGIWSASKGFEISSRECSPFLREVAVGEFAQLGRTFHLQLVVIVAELRRRGAWR